MSHRHHNADHSTDKNSRRPQNAGTPNTVAVYAPGFKYVVNLPPQAIHHMPPNGLSVTRLVLCANYDARSPQASCPMGSHCKFVHADTRQGQQHDIHVNYAWRSLEEVTYERMPPGQLIKVAAPNTKIATDVMESHLVLKTRAMSSTRRPLSHCAHYYFNRTCNLGPKCHFVHAVFVDPEAKPHQRAPVPSQLGEGRELQLSKRQRELMQEGGLVAAPRAPPQHNADSPALPSLTGSVSSVIQEGAVSGNSSQHGHEDHTGRVSPLSEGSPSAASTVYRHNPYRAVAIGTLTPPPMVLSVSSV